MASFLMCRRLHLSSSSFVSHCLPLCVSSSLTRFNVPGLPPPNARFFSASSKAEMEEAERVSANERLKHVLKTKITSWPETFSLPRDCPFELVPDTYDPDDCAADFFADYATFKRKFYGEDIEVTVRVIDFDLDYEDEEEEKGDDNKDGEDEDAHPSSELSIKIDKGNGICLEYSCSTYLKEFTVDKMHLKSCQIKEDGTYSGEKRYNYMSEYTRPPGKLDAETAEAAKQCLEARGIDGSLVKLAEQYVLSKNLQHRDWLKKFEKFATV